MYLPFLFFVFMVFTGSAQERPTVPANAQTKVANTTDQLTKISGTFNKPQTDEVGLRFYRDLISFDEELYLIPIDEHNRFSMNFKLSQPTTAVLSYNGREIPLYIEPGDDLKILCDGRQFPHQLVFKGKGSTHNMYLKSFNNAFSFITEESVLYEITSMQPMVFRRYIDQLHQKKWNHYIGYDRSKRRLFSEHFKHYMFAEIDYWKAYQLLRYRIEHAVANNKSVPLTLPVSYYNFLREILVNNDEALDNRYYLFFLEQYLNLRKDNPKELQENNFQSTSIYVNISSVAILNQPEMPPVLTEITQGDRLLYLNEKTDFKSKVLIKDALHEGYWYKVKTATGITGWVIGVGLQFEEEEESPHVVILGDRIASLNNKIVAKYLKGKALYYITANDIYWRSHIEPEEMLSLEIENFLLNNPVPEYDHIIRDVWETIKQSDQKNEVVYGATIYRIVKEPTILSSNFNEKTNSVADKSKPEKQKNQISTPQELPKVVAPVVVDEPKIKNKKQDISKIKKPSVIEKNNATPPQEALTDYVQIEMPAPERAGSVSQFSGKVNNYFVKPFKLVLYSDPIRYEEIVYNISVSPNHTFTVDFNLTAPAVARLVYGDDQMEIYVEPGDQLHANFDGANFKQSMEFAGQGSVHNNYLVKATLQFELLGNQIQQKMRVASPEDFSDFLNHCRNNKHQFLEAYSTTDFSTGFKAYALADIDYWYAYQRFNFPWEYEMRANNKGKYLPKSYYKFLNDLEVCNDRALPNQHYVYFLDQFFNYQKEQEENAGLTNMQLAKKYLFGDPLNFYKAKLLSMACLRGKAKESGPVIKQFIAENPNEIYNDVLRFVYNDAKGLLKGESAPEFLLIDRTGKEVALADLRGKIIFLDFWATWCQPCVQSLKNSKQWKKEFEDKAVEFVYISLDEDKTAWTNFVTRHGIKGTHLSVRKGSGYQSEIAKRYKVKRLPTYFIIDKNGKIYFNSSDKKTQLRRSSEMINELLLSN